MNQSSSYHLRAGKLVQNTNDPKPYSENAVNTVALDKLYIN